MDVEAVQLFAALLAIVAGVGAVGLLVARIVAPQSAAVATVDQGALWLAFVVAATATAGSLYFSEVADYEPCRLCWYQRIAMYPLVVILLVAAIRHDRAVRWYAGPVAAIGAAISTYHYVVEWNPSLDAGACGLGPSCTAVWFREFGFISLALMALCGFAAILVLVVPRTSSNRMENTP